MSLNRKSQWMVDNCYQGFKRFNPDDTITKCSEGDDTMCLRWEKSGRLYRIYRFHAGWSGDLTRLTIHGVNTVGEYNAMSRSGVAFGIRISSLKMKEGSDGPYVEVELESY